MRLTCPECDAQYEVEDALIPAEGRSVECARCGHLWHQAGRKSEAFVLGDSDLAPQVAGPVIRPTWDDDDRPRTSAAALEILREEARREMAQRAADRARADEAARQREVASASPEFVVAELVDDREVPQTAEPDREADEPIANLDWRELPPGAQDAPDSFATAPAGHDTVPPPGARTLGYNAGFGIALASMLIIGGFYVAAPVDGGESSVGRGLASYRAEVDRGRSWLFDRVAPLFGGD